MIEELADTIPTETLPLYEPRIQRTPQINPYGTAGLLICAASAVLVCWAVVELLAWWLL